MKKHIPKVFLILISLWVLSTALKSYKGLSKKTTDSFDVNSFAQLPIQNGGRIKPIDTLAKISLRIMSNRQAVRLPNGDKLTATEWIMDVIMNPEKADKHTVFRIDNDQILGLFEWKQKNRKHFSFEELRPHLQTIDEQARTAFQKEKELRSVYEEQLTNLYNKIMLYEKLIPLIHPISPFTSIPEKEYKFWLDLITTGKLPGSEDQTSKLPEHIKPEQLRQFMEESYTRLVKRTNIGIIPPSDPTNTHWVSLGQSLMDVKQTKTIHPILNLYSTLILSYQSNEVKTFNQTLEELHSVLGKRIHENRNQFEYFFNLLQPFYLCIVIYVITLLLAMTSWLVLPTTFQKSANALLLLTFGIHTFGLLARMYIQERPPVTNLYSSAILVGWGAGFLSIFLERINKNGIGSAVASIIGIATLIIAHHLDASGDSMEMMRAVLDSNFWLATHVIIITIGYSGMFLAGTLALIYIIRGTLTSSLDKKTAKSLSKMVYAITCFSALFSFVGTMLGGIWADQSWGRFWGWDPKENGALLIVLWCAIVLHAKLGKLVKDRGIMTLTIFGNVVTSFSWFGTNMLGVGLHSYGFMDKAFVWLSAFIISQLLIMGLSLIPLKSWKSYEKIT